MSIFNERVDKSVSFLDDYFNHKKDGDPVSRAELKETLVTVLELIKEDHDSSA